MEWWVILLILLGSISFIWSVVSIWVIINLLKKLETAEVIVSNYVIWADKLSRVVEISDEKVQKLDQKGIFSSDDEIGFFFKTVQAIQNILNEFNVKKL